MYYLNDDEVQQLYTAIKVFLKNVKGFDKDREIEIPRDVPEEKALDTLALGLARVAIAYGINEDTSLLVLHKAMGIALKYFRFEEPDYIKELHRKMWEQNPGM